MFAPVESTFKRTFTEDDALSLKKRGLLSVLMYLLFCSTEPLLRRVCFPVGLWMVMFVCCLFYCGGVGRRRMNSTMRELSVCCRK
jgi:hypothetical protein